MKTTLWAFAIVSAVLLGIAALWVLGRHWERDGSSPVETTPQIGTSRYQLLAATVEDSSGNKMPRLFKIDTSTGTAWKLDISLVSIPGKVGAEIYGWDEINENVAEGKVRVLKHYEQKR